MTFTLDGNTLTPDYDEAEDVLYLWVGDGPCPAVSYETEEGHLVQLDPETKAFVGVVIADYSERWRGKAITLEIPMFEQRVLEPA